MPSLSAASTSALVWYGGGNWLSSSLGSNGKRWILQRLPNAQRNVSLEKIIVGDRDASGLIDALGLR